MHALSGEARVGHEPHPEKRVMKKFLTMSVLALSLAAVSQQQASAWCKFTFGFGLNLSFERAGNGLGRSCHNGYGMAWDGSHQAAPAFPPAPTVVPPGSKAQAPAPAKPGDTP